MAVNTVQYNKEDYSLDIDIYRLNDAGEVDPKTYLFVQKLLNDNILKIEFISDIITPILMGSFVFRDYGYEVFPKIGSPNGNLFCSIILKKIPTSTTTEVIIQESFQIFDIVLSDKSHESGDYVVKIISSDWVKFNNFFTYSSMSEKPYTQMIRDIFNTNKLNFDSGNFVNSSSSGFYISQSNKQMINTLNDILYRTSDENKGLYFINYDHIDKIYRLCSLNDLINKIKNPNNNENKSYIEKYIPIDNILNLPSKDEQTVVQRTANDIVQRSYNSFDTRYEICRPFNWKDFSYSNRSWTDDNYTFTRLIDKAIQQSQTLEYQKQFRQFNKVISNDVKRENKVILHSEIDYLYKTLRNMFLYTDTIEFRCYGVMGRFAGQLINLFGANNELVNKYGGLWFVARVYHQFFKNEYINVIQASRIDEKIFKFNDNRFR